MPSSSSLSWLNSLTSLVSLAAVFWMSRGVAWHLKNCYEGDYNITWLTTSLFFRQARVMLIYRANWRSIYFDLFAFGLSTVDPFVHPVTCILVSRRYRAGYADAFKDIVSRIRGWICSFKPRTRVDPLDCTPSVSNTYNSGLIHVTWQHESRVNLRNNCDNSAQCATPKAHASVLRLDVIQET